MALLRHLSKEILKSPHLAKKKAYFHHDYAPTHHTSVAALSKIHGLRFKLLA